MKINKLTASFGKLENESLSFHDGLNVIYAPNESGKSTWCAFILAMLYGVDSSQRAKAGVLPDKQRYAPWSGAPMEGSMELSASGNDITIVRSTKAKNAPMREFSATYTGSNVAVEGLTGTNCGEQLTGVSKDVFRRSAFVAQGTVAVSGSPELEKRISAIVSTGEEQSSYSEADDRLRQWQRKRRYNRRGLLPELEASMDETQRRLQLMDGSMQDIESLEAQLEQSRQNCQRLEQQVTDSRKRQRREALDRLSKGRAETEQCSARHDEAMAQLSECRDALRGSAFGIRPLDDVEQQVAQDVEALSSLKAAAAKKPSPVPALVFFLLAVVCAAVYTRFNYIAVIIFSAVFCVAALFMLLRFNRDKHRVNQALDQRRQLLRKYKAGSTGDITSALAEHRRLTAAVNEAEADERRSRTAYETARDFQQELEEQAMAELDFTGGNSEAAQLSRELAQARATTQRLSQQIYELNGRLSTMGDPLVLSSSLGSMRDEYELISQEYDAIGLAIDTLKAADTEIQSRFSPELGRVAAGYMSMVTSGRYADVLINRDFSAKTRTADDTIARDSEYLSAGTMDLMYLAVRLAVCELALPKGESCPLIIDDALVNLDETRLQQALELLRRISKERQVIVFSCRKLLEDKA
jgi:DNA repair exonuclease SbcCD ATPase subunit